MANTCIELLNTFTQKEHQELKLFIQEGFHNTDKKLVVLYNELTKYIIGKTNLNDGLMVRIHNKIFNQNLKNEKLSIKDKKKINELLSALTRLAEDYLSSKFLQLNINTKKEILYKALLERKQFKLLQKHLNSDRKKLLQTRKKGRDFYHFLNQIEYCHLEISYQAGLFEEQSNLININLNLDTYYVLKKLSLWLSMLSLEQKTQRKFDYTDFEAIENYINITRVKENPAVILNLAMVNLLKFKTQKAYELVLNLLNKYEDIVDNEIIIGGYYIATNFCTFNIKRDIFTHFKILELYKILDNKKLLLENGFMPSVKLKNIISAACRTMEFGWGETILEKYINYVNKPYKKSIYEFNRGVINFYQKKYNIALHNFIRVGDVNLVYDINCRIMTMKAHYEVDKNYDERTMQIFRSAEKYFSANKLISNNNKMAYKNFVRMLINLYRLKHNETKMKTSSFTEKLNAQKFNQDKNWLLSKLKEIK